VASFTIGATEAIFGANIRGSRQESGDLQRLTLTVTLWDATEWTTLRDLVTSKHHVHATLGGDPIVDVVRGPGAGTLVVDTLGETSAILISLERSTYLPYARSQGTAVFLVTGEPL
jgi:hypothetical protein